MNISIRSDLFPDLPTTIVYTFSYGLIGILFFLLYKKQAVKPKIFYAFIVCLVGLFMFSINIQNNGSVIKIPILPLGVWILYWILSSKGNKDRWNRYRAFAWLGFFANFIFSITFLFITPLNEWLFPSNEITSYITEVNNASIITTYPSTNSATLNQVKLHSQLAKMKEEPIDGLNWYNQESVNLYVNNKNEEKFPYMLIGTTPKKGSGIKAIIYVERDGKGLLISCPSKQYYFRAKEPFLDFKKEGTHDD